MIISTTDELVKRWLDAGENVKRDEAALGRSRVALTNAETALAKRLKPDDMAPGECISTWVRVGEKKERLLVVTCDASVGNYELKWRSEAHAVKEE